MQAMRQTKPDKSSTTRSRPLWAVVCLLALALSWLAPAAASAHEKWFVDSRDYPLRAELIFSLPVLVALGAALLALGALVLLRRRVRDSYWPDPPWLRPVNSSVQAVVGIQTAISLVYMAVQGWLLAPLLVVSEVWWGFLLLALQLFVAFTLVTGWFTRVGGALLIGLVAVAFLIFPASKAAEQLLFVGIGAYFLIQGRGLFRPVGPRSRALAQYWFRYSKLALSLMRVFTGLSILWLAFSEKLLNPGLALAFLRTRPEFNFMHLLGFNWFTDDLFIYAAAAVEATVGVLLIAGVLPRVVILFMWVPFNIAIPVLPPQELLGHLPILAVMYAVFLGEVPDPARLGEPVGKRLSRPLPVHEP